MAEGASAISTSPDINVVGPGYFALLDIPVKQGREFTAADRESSPPVAVVNETMARRFWNGDPVGKAFTDEETGAQDPRSSASSAICGIDRSAKSQCRWCTSARTSVRRGG